MKEKSKLTWAEEMERIRGFNEEEWRYLNGDLKTLVSLRGHITGSGNKLFKHIINVLVAHEKRLNTMLVVKRR